MNIYRRANYLLGNIIYSFFIIHLCGLCVLRG